MGDCVGYLTTQNTSPNHVHTNTLFLWIERNLLELGVLVCEVEQDLVGLGVDGQQSLLIHIGSTLLCVVSVSVLCVLSALHPTQRPVPWCVGVQAMPSRLP